MLAPPECNGNLDECPNVKQLCQDLAVFHNKSVEELMNIQYSISDTVKIINNYDHLTSKHNLYGHEVHDLPEVFDEDKPDPQQMSDAEAYAKFQGKVNELISGRLKINLRQKIVIL